MTQIDWSGILTITCVGFCLVIVMLLAAIMTALKLFGSARHDRETEMLTILSIKRAYSPWNSKIHGLTQMPDYRK